MKGLNFHFFKSRILSQPSLLKAEMTVFQINMTLLAQICLESIFSPDSESFFQIIVHLGQF